MRLINVLGTDLTGTVFYSAVIESYIIIYLIKFIIIFFNNIIH